MDTNTILLLVGALGGVGAFLMSFLRDKNFKQWVDKMVSVIDKAKEKADEHESAGDEASSRFDDIADNALDNSDLEEANRKAEKEHSDNAADLNEDFKNDVDAFKKASESGNDSEVNKKVEDLESDLKNL